MPIDSGANLYHLNLPPTSEIQYPIEIFLSSSKREFENFILNAICDGNKRTDFIEKPTMKSVFCIDHVIVKNIVNQLFGFSYSKSTTGSL
ncbi:hypothetical protein BMS3Bbin10_01339 [bacterium BMS3Bbin10]|nr:hypothetical protein BMS3Bbin10_01339 [bacterium BMS3Bbin10]